MYSVLVLVSLFVLLPFHGSQTVSISLVPQIWNVPLSNPAFIGRKKLLQALQYQLHTKNSPLVALVGLPGIGKTQLIKRYAHQHASEYTIIWWFDCSKDLALQFVNFAEAWNRGFRDYKDQLPQEALTPLGVVPLVKECLRRTRYTWLLIFDDCKESSQLRPYLPERHGKLGKHVLVTSKNTDAWRIIMKLEKFNREESLQYLKHILPSANEKELAHLAEVLGDYPLALSRGASLIKVMPQLTIPAYCDLFQKKRQHLKKQEEKHAFLIHDEDYNKTLTAAFELSLDELKITSPIAYQALCFLAFLNHTGITDALLTAWLEKRNDSNEVSQEIITLLTSRLLLEAESEKEVSNKKAFYSTHELIQVIVRDTLTTLEQTNIIETAATLLLSYFQGASSQLCKAVSHYPELYEHAKKLCEVAYANKISSPSLLKLKINLMHIANYYTNELPYSELLGAQLEEEIKGKKPLDPFMQARYLTTLSNVFMWKDLDVSIERAKAALSILDSLTGKEVEEEIFWASINNLGSSYSQQGNISAAINALESRKGILEGLNNKDYYSNYHARMAHYGIYKGNYDEALAHIEKAAANLESLPPADASAVKRIFVKVLKTEIIARQGHHKQALTNAQNLYKEALEIYQTPLAYNPIHLRLIIALCLKGLNRLDDAKKEAESGLAECRKAFGSHCGVDGAFAHFLLGDILEKEDKFHNALKEYKAADDIYNTTLKKKELDDISRLYARLAILGVKLKDPTITRIYLQQHIQHFGRNHPRTAEIAKYCDDHKVPIPW